MRRSIWNLEFLYVEYLPESGLWFYFIKNNKGN
jgi:hypothetical protein